MDSIIGQWDSVDPSKMHIETTTTLRGGNSSEEILLPVKLVKTPKVRKSKVAGKILLVAAAL